MNDAEAAWVSGLYEGEGSVIFGKDDRSISIQLSSTDEDVVRRFAELTGGRVTGPYRQDHGKWKPFWRSSLAGWDKVGALYVAMKPWLLSRRISRLEEMLSKRPPTREYSEPCGRTREGSQYGWLLHHRHGEPPCKPCCDAKAEYMLDWRRDRDAGVIRENRGRTVEASDDDDCGWRGKDEPSRGGLRRHKRLGELPCRRCLEMGRKYSKNWNRAQVIR